MPRPLGACRSDENDRDMPLPRLVGHRGRGGSNTRFARENWEVISVRQDRRPATIIRTYLKIADCCRSAINEE